MVCGFTDRADDRKQVGSLLLGVYADGALIPVGSVGTGWTGREATALRAKLSALEPQLAVLTSDVPAHGDWLYEVKFDGS